MTARQKKTLIRIIIAIILSVAVHFIPVDGIYRLVLFIVPYLVIGYDVLWSALRNIFHGQIFDEKFLMAIATIGAFATGEYPEASAVMIFYQIGELFQGIAVGKSRKSIAALMDIRPDFANVIRDGKENNVSPEDVAIGEIIIVRPGEKIPLDGEIVDGKTSVNTAALTGESLPVDKKKGDKVISGTINLSGAVYIKPRVYTAKALFLKFWSLLKILPKRKRRRRIL